MNSVAIPDTESLQDPRGEINALRRYVSGKNLPQNPVCVHINRHSLRKKIPLQYAAKNLRLCLFRRFLWGKENERGREENQGRREQTVGGDGKWIKELSDPSASTIKYKASFQIEKVIPQLHKVLDLLDELNEFIVVRF